MAKVSIKSEKITPFGGIYYASKAFYALSLDKVIGRHSWCPQFYLQRLPVGRDSASMYSRIQDIREWRRVEIGSQETKVASCHSMLPISSELL